MAAGLADTRSRRALLMGAFGGVAAVVAQALGRPAPVRGADVVLGGTNNTTQTTTIQNTANEELVLAVLSDEGIALGAAGWAGAFLVGRNRAGVTGIQSSTPLLRRVPAVKAGVIGIGEDIGVRGTSSDRVGVLGFAGSNSGPTNMPPNVGVYGWSTTEGGGVSMGVLGRSTAPVGYGVFGTSEAGSGVSGFTEDGIAVAATVGSGGSGRALAVSGRVSFTSSGIATVNAGNDQKVVTPGVPLTPTSKVLATVMGNAGPGVVLKRVSVDAAADKFTIVLSGNAANNTAVAWFVLD
jgi:hypothetical protein